MAQTDPLKTYSDLCREKGHCLWSLMIPITSPIHEAAPVKDPILLLFHRIDMAESESVNLLTGFRGNGKSTELKRLKKLLEEEGDAQVFLVNMLDYVLMTKPLELSDFILSLMAALAGKAEETVEALAPLSQSYWERLSNFLTSEVQLEKLDIGTKGIGMTAKFGFKLKTDPEFKSKIQTHLQGHLTRLVEDAQQFVDELVRKSGN